MFRLIGAFVVLLSCFVFTLCVGGLASIDMDHDMSFWEAFEATWCLIGLMGSIGTGFLGAFLVVEDL
jgi:hypothetical protein